MKHTFSPSGETCQDLGGKLLDLIELLQVDILPFVINPPNMPIKM